jgi:hypothetical protein
VRVLPRLLFVGLSLALAVCCSAAPTEVPPAQSIPSPENPPYPPLDHPKIKQFAAAMNLSRRVSEATDPFWLPGKAILRDSNVGRETDVNGLVSRLRAERDGLYVATALFQIDKRLSHMLVPGITQAEAEVMVRYQEIYRQTRAVDSPEQKRLGAEFQDKVRAARPMADLRLDALARLARTPASADWLSGLKKGNYRCLKVFHQTFGNQAFADKLVAEHCRAAWKSSYDRFVVSEDGRAFAELSSALYVSALAGMAMSFDAGLTLESFLPRREVESAGLIYPDRPVSSEELSRRYEAMSNP